MPSIQDFSKWDGTPFFSGFPKGGRQTYVVKMDEAGGFLAYGVIGSNNQFVFEVRGVGVNELDAFLAEMNAEGSAITYDNPPLETQTGGDKPPSTGPTGIKPRPLALP
jgi:hypothetical protein